MGMEIQQKHRQAASCRLPEGFSFCKEKLKLKKRKIKKLKVVYSKELPIAPIDDTAISCRQHCICPPGTARKCTQRRQVPGSTAFVPSVLGLIIAGEVIKDITGFKGRGIGA